jgi:acyl-coenzyme A thioesterase PaaI-like protein
MDGEIERDSQCFCCGEDNERGLHLDFSYPEKGKAETQVELPNYLSGWKGIAHGGFLSMLLDEIMAHSCIGTADLAVTGEITVRFKKPAPTGARVRVVGKLEGTKGRLLSTRGWIYDAEGVCLAEATAKFITMGQAGERT